MSRCLHTNAAQQTAVAAYGMRQPVARVGPACQWAPCTHAGRSVVQGMNVVTYVYELHGEEVKVKKIEHTKSQPQGARPPPQPGQT